MMAGAFDDGLALQAAGDHAGAVAALTRFLDHGAPRYGRAGER